MLYKRDQIKDDKMGGTYSMHEEMENVLKILMEGTIWDNWTQMRV